MIRNPQPDGASYDLRGTKSVDQLIGPILGLQGHDRLASDDWLGRARTELTSIGQILATLPRQMDSYYKAANRGELQMRVDLSRREAIA